MQKITRRNLAALTAGGAVALGAAKSASPAQQPAPASADELAAARKQIARNLETLATYELPMSTEPAFVFKA